MSPFRGRGTLGHALVLGLLLAASLPAFADAPLTAGADVVVLTGLPGDVESEKAYQDQAQRLLEILAREGSRPRRVFVLADAPQALSVPRGLPAEVGRATREGVLALAARIDGAAPLVVFAWGHGGFQGEMPVFHVRGPRLAPEDLKALASRAGMARFVLFFRGSGLFARALQALDREILASESTVAFRSDPIGIPLLLRILADEPAAPMPALAARLGRATKEWYESRRLARQEEPTLWAGDRETAPKELVREVEGTPKAEGAPGVAKRAELPEAWRTIRRVEARRFPEADAVVLRSSTSYTLGEDPAIAAESDEFIQVLTDEGKRYGDFDVSYSPPFEALTFLDCEVLRPDGTLERLDPDQIRDAGRPAMGEYATASRKIFSLPHVAPGAVLRVHTQREWKQFPLPHVSLELPLSGDAPVVASRLEVRVSSKAAFHFAFRNTAPKDPAITETGYGRVYAWSFEDVAPQADEVLGPPVRTASLLLSTFPDWAAFADWYRGLIQEADRITPEISAKAAELTKAARTEREKVKAVYDYVTGLRYVAVPLGVNSHRPHAAASVLRASYGDCKDKANLFNTLLRSLGIEADLVLVPRFSQAHDATPGLAFNHAISRVRVGGEVVWADTTDDIARFGLLPPGDPGRKVLVIDGRSTALTELPSPDPAGHKIGLEAEVRASPDETGALPGAVEVKTSGYADYELRQVARQTGARGAQPVLTGLLRPAVGLFAMTSQSHTSVAALDQEFSWRAEGAFLGLLAPLPSGGWLLHPPFWLPREWDAALNRRTTPLYLHQGYPLALHEEIAMAVPASARGLALPPPQASQTGPLRWRVEWAKAGERVLGRLDVELRTGELTWDETVSFQDQLRGLTAALAAGITYELSR